MSKALKILVVAGLIVSVAAILVWKQRDKEERASSGLTTAAVAAVPSEPGLPPSWIWGRISASRAR
ncbi:MAG TPA: hypothetical protein PK373_04610 [Sedimentisphaerales bacterium]|nr:hypothetical protein [Sedimentisphaerales bacterium]